MVLASLGRARPVSDAGAGIGKAPAQTKICGGGIATGAKFLLPRTGWKAQSARPKSEHLFADGRWRRRSDLAPPFASRRHFTLVPERDQGSRIGGRSRPFSR